MDLLGHSQAVAICRGTCAHIRTDRRLRLAVRQGSKRRMEGEGDSCLKQKSLETDCGGTIFLFFTYNETNELFTLQWTEAMSR